MPTTVVSWNLNHWQRRPEQRAASWAYLADEVKADVALVQEAGVPPDGWSHVGDEIGGRRAWGTRVVSPAWPLVEVTEVRPLRASQPQAYAPWRAGTAATATAEVNGLALTLISLYGLMEPRNAYESMNRHLADLAPLLDAPDHFRQVVVGGDLNLTSQWSGESAGYAPIDRALLDQFRAWGLRDLVAESSGQRLDGCPCSEGDDCRHRKTWWRSGDDVPRQNDYVFASSRLPANPSLRVDESAVQLGLSDHAPLIVSLET